jgi:glutathione S-transferase
LTPPIAVTDSAASVVNRPGDDMANDLLLYGLKGSPFVRKVQVFLAEKAIDFDFEMASPFPAPDWFAEISPLKRIPVLRDRAIGTEGTAGTIPDSSVICAYLERKYPNPPLYPANDFDFARALWLEEYADSEMAGHVGLGLFRPMVMSRLGGKEPDVNKAQETLRDKLPPVFDYLDSAISGREFMVGDQFGIADIAVATQFVNFVLAGAKLDATRWPDLAAWMERLHARPSFAACLAAERKFMPAAEVEL